MQPGLVPSFAQFFAFGIEACVSACADGEIAARALRTGRVRAGESSAGDLTANSRVQACADASWHRRLRNASASAAIAFGLALHCVLAGVPSFAAERSATPPPIMSRAAWGARPADPSLMKAQTPRGIVIHHTGQKRAPELPLREKLRRLETFARSAGMVGTTPKPPWGDVPYHFYVDASGRIGEGRSLAYAGDSNTPYDTSDLIQIVVEGDFNTEQPTPTQLAALDRLVVRLAARYRIAAQRLAGHSDHATATECPGDGLKAHLPALRSKVANAVRR